MEIGLYMYNTSPLFEIIVAKYILETKHNVIIISDEDKFKTAENIEMGALPIKKVLLQNELQALIICGGDTNKVKHTDTLCELIRKTNQKKGIIASICSGNMMVTKALGFSEMNDDFQGVKLFEDNVLMSSADNYIQFGIELGRLLNVYVDKSDYDETVEFFLTNQVNAPIQ